MTVNWYDEPGGDPASEDGEMDMVYCPYTNSDKCAAVEKGWQAQELCEALECSQIKYIQRGRQRRHKAA